MKFVRDLTLVDLLVRVAVSGAFFKPVAFMSGTVCLACMVAFVLFIALGRGDLAFISALVAIVAIWPNTKR